MSTLPVLFRCKSKKMSMIQNWCRNWFFSRNFFVFKTFRPDMVSGVLTILTHTLPVSLEIKCFCSKKKQFFLELVRQAHFQYNATKNLSFLQIIFSILFMNFGKKSQKFWNLVKVKNMLSFFQKACLGKLFGGKNASARRSSSWIIFWRSWLFDVTIIWVVNCGVQDYVSVRRKSLWWGIQGLFNIVIAEISDLVRSRFSIWVSIL